ncbi:MAG: hypothetical protein ATN36_03120 [Epulopiscium sp. Nele67-Bin005]|nr:MAG: hypothetical protein ATN36_03120 [Epulopiscium sp. Nele67-Bin005]
MKTKSIATKLATRIAMIVTINLLSLIIVSVWQSMGAVQTAIDLEFQVVSEQNATLVESIIDNTFMAIENLSDYMTDTYEKLSKIPEEQLSYENRSELYGVPIATQNYLAENYFINNAFSSVLTDKSDIYEMGVYFEPYAFDENIHTYGFNMTYEQAKRGVYTPQISYDLYKNEEFYKKTIETGEEQIFLPVLQPDGTELSYVTAPIIYDGEVKGVVMGRMIASSFARTKSEDPHYPSMGGIVVTDDLVRIYDSLEGSSTVTFTEKSLNELQTLMKTGKSFITRATSTDGDDYMRYFAPIQVLEDTWWASVRLDIKDYQKSAVEIAITLSIVSVIALASLVFFATLVIRHMLKPINAVVDAAAEIKAGNLDVHIDYSEPDEIGELATTFKEMGANLKSIINETNQTLSEIAAGDLTTAQSLKASYPGQFEPIKISMMNISDMLSDTMTKINYATDSVAQGADSIAQGAIELAEGSTEQASIIEEFISSTELIGKSINQTLEQVASTSQLSDEARAKANQGTQSMNSMVISMDKINKSSLVIAEVLQTVDDIAAQTNLLALNASIESARAGEAGKGFAVVATEIRELANRSSETVKEIEEIIKQSFSYIEEGQHMAKETENSLDEIVETVEKTATFFQQLVASTQEQKTSVTELLSGTQQISAVVQTNAATSEESASTSEQLAKEAERLQAMLKYFKY